MLFTAARKSKGFTIVELLIVIVIIAILAAITVVAYNGIQDRAKATAISDGISKIDKAFQLYAIAESQSAWPIISGNPTMDDMIEDLDGFDNYLQSPPAVDFIEGVYWDYDNDGDVRDMAACDIMTPGVNLRLNDFADREIAQQVDDAIDDGNLNCGKLRHNPDYSKLIYILSPDQEFS